MSWEAHLFLLRITDARLEGEEDNVTDNHIEGNQW